MPKTFSESDVVRIWCKHLELKEQVTVMIVFIFVLPRLFIDKVTEDSSSKLLPIIRNIKRVLLLEMVSRTLKVLIDSLLSPQLVKTLDNCFEFVIIRTVKARLFGLEEEKRKLVDRSCNLVIDVLQGVARFQKVGLSDLSLTYFQKYNKIWSLRIRVRFGMTIRILELSREFNLNLITMLRMCVDLKINILNKKK